jgi:hypothetical protein
MLNKLHDKKFETWDRLHVLICNFIHYCLLIANTHVIRNHLVVQGLSLFRHDCVFLLYFVDRSSSKDYW